MITFLIISYASPNDTLQHRLACITGAITNTTNTRLVNNADADTSRTPTAILAISFISLLLMALVRLPRIFLSALYYIAVHGPSSACSETTLKLELA